MDAWNLLLMLMIDRVSLSQGSHKVLSELSLNLARGEIGVVMGRSGAGKTSLLHAIAGFLSIDKGAICFGDHILSTADYTQSPEKRRIGMVFQDYALFPHLTARANVLFGLRRMNGREKGRRLEEVVALTHIENFLHKYPYDLSGGEQQRVAIARTLVTQVDLMLLDEPFSNLDADLRRRLSFGVRTFLKEHRITGLVVSHDRVEGLNICDRIGNLHEGIMEKWLDKRDLEPEPARIFPAH